MADGVTHDRYIRLGWYLIFPLGGFIFLLAILLKLENSILYPVFLYLNYLQCHIINPDNDQPSLTLAEGIVLRVSKRFWMGFFGALFVCYSFMYAYIIGLFGGHRSWASHGWVIGTIGRMIYFSILPISITLYNIYIYAIARWNAPLNATLQSIFLWEYLKIYLFTQFIAWNIGDGIHLILDTEWAKGRLYTPIKIKRNG